jgi:tetratricopeptide (TPR) repeat protein
MKMSKEKTSTEKSERRGIFLLRLFIILGALLPFSGIAMKSAPDSTRTVSKFRIEAAIYGINGPLAGKMELCTAPDSCIAVPYSGTRFTLEPELDKIYILRFSAPGHEIKVVELDTRIPKDRQYQEFAEMILQIELRESKTMEKPSALTGMIKYDSKTKEFGKVGGHDHKGLNKALELVTQGVQAGIAGKKQKAVSLFTESIAADSSNSDAFFERGVVYYELKNYAAAIKDFNKAISLYPEDARIYSFRSLAYAEIPDYRSALADVDQALRIIESNADYVNRAILRELMEDFDGALSDYNKAIAMDGSDMDSYYYRGLLHQQLGNQAQGCADLKIAAGLGSKEAKAEMAKSCK